MLRGVLLPRATRYQLYSPAQKFPPRTIKLLRAHSGILLQKKQLIKYYFEYMLITKEKNSQEISQMSCQAFSLILHLSVAEFVKSPSHKWSAATKSLQTVLLIHYLVARI